MVDRKLITTACHLYRQGLLAMLPFSIVFVLILHLISMSTFKNMAIFLGVLTLPIISAWIVVLSGIQQQKPYAITDVLLTLLERFASLMATLFSMLLVPAILLCAGVILMLLLKQINVPSIGITLCQIIIGAGIFASITRKLMAPLLIFTASLDANDALEKSDLLVKGHFKRTFFYSLYAILFFGLLLNIATWLPWLIPATQNLPPIVLRLSSEVLAGLLGPWSIALWFALFNDLQSRAS